MYTQKDFENSLDELQKINKKARSQFFYQSAGQVAVMCALLFMMYMLLAGVGSGWHRLVLQIIILILTMFNFYLTLQKPKEGREIKVLTAFLNEHAEQLTKKQQYAAYYELKEAERLYASRTLRTR